MRTIDQWIIEEAGVDALALMEAAGAAAADLAVRSAHGALRCTQDVAKSGSDGLNHLDTRRHPLCIHVAVGKGHNGADGLVAARHLLGAGHSVRVWLTVAEGELSALTVRQLVSYQRLGGTLAGPEDRFEDADVILDALLGSGSRLPLSNRLRLLTRAIHASRRPVVAIDLPTGVDADTGQTDPDALCAIATLALGFGKPGLFQYPGRSHTGNVSIATLSLPVSAAEQSGVKTRLLTTDWAATTLHARPADAHKGTFGPLGVIAGSPGMYGAARLAIESAYRSGAGLVHYLAPMDLPDPISISLPTEAVIRFHKGSYRTWTSERVRACAAELAKTTCAILGPGLGEIFWAAAAGNAEFLRPFAELPIPLVLDADFLRALSVLPDRGREWFSLRQAPTLLTPHPREFSRLTDQPVDRIQAHRLQAATAYAAAHGVYVALKGAGTIAAAPDGNAAIASTGNSGLATAGTGDVLAGLVGGLCASGYTAAEALPLAVYLHGRAADLACDAAQSEESLIASDLRVWLGKTFQELHAQKLRS